MRFTSIDIKICELALDYLDSEGSQSIWEFKGSYQNRMKRFRISYISSKTGLSLKFVYDFYSYLSFKGFGTIRSVDGQDYFIVSSCFNVSAIAKEVIGQAKLIELASQPTA